MRRQSTAALVALALAMGGVVACESGSYAEPGQPADVGVDRSQPRRTLPAPKPIKARPALTVCNGPARILCTPKRPLFKAPKRVSPTYPGPRVAAA